MKGIKFVASILIARPVTTGFGGYWEEICYDEGVRDYYSDYDAYIYVLNGPDDEEKIYNRIRNNVNPDI